MEERLQKIIAARGLCSRRCAEEWITAGRVRVNGNTARLGDTADTAEDVIEVDGKRLPSPPALCYLVLNKPRGYVTTLSDDRGRPTVLELVENCGQRVYPVGRLDYDSEGLLLFTNDGAFANRIMHPSHAVDKTYLVWVTGFGHAALSRLMGMETLEGEPIAKPAVHLRRADGDNALLEVTIHEGKNRQVRRMCQQVGLSVTRLRRIAEGGVALDRLPSGTWRYLTTEELNSFHLL